MLDTVCQALPQVGNLGLLFFLLFFIFAALGVELFGRLECSDDLPCQGLGEHAHFANFGIAFLTLFRISTYIYYKSMSCKVINRYFIFRVQQPLIREKIISLF